MRSQLVGYVIALTVGYGLCGVASAQPRNRNTGTKASTDKTIDKQMEWENRVMGEDSAKRADMKKIANAQRLADEAAKHPAPVAAPKVKDPSKEGVRAKQEAAIGLPIASDQQGSQTPRKSASAKKAAQPTSSANDELGALVATSLAQNKSASAGSDSTGARSNKTMAPVAGGSKARGRGRGRASTSAATGSPSSLDKMFAASGQ